MGNTDAELSKIMAKIRSAVLAGDFMNIRRLAADLSQYDSQSFQAIENLGATLHNEFGPEKTMAVNKFIGSLKLSVIEFKGLECAICSFFKIYSLLGKRKEAVTAERIDGFLKCGDDLFIMLEKLEAKDKDGAFAKFSADLKDAIADRVKLPEIDDKRNIKDKQGMLATIASRNQQNRVPMEKVSRVYVFPTQKNRSIRIFLN